MSEPTRPAPCLSWPVRLRFASGDFACNLYWQSSSLFLFFYYTDVLRLAPALAGLIYMAGSVWDGIADLLAGLWAERSGRRYGQVIAYGAIPLGLAFPLLYVAPPLHGAAFVGLLLVAQLAFRSLYALVNIPYAAWSARISSDSRDRAAIAGLRMLFGTLAAILVSLATERISLAISGSRTGAGGFLATAALCSLIATPLLIHIARHSPEGDSRTSYPNVRSSLRRDLSALAANRAFVTLCLAMVCVATAATMLSRSVLYYFAYVARNEPAGPGALALMGIAGSLFVPLWMVTRHRIGSRAVWMVAVGLALAASMVFGLADTGEIWRACAFLIAMQAALAGFSFVFWAMLPDTVEFGEHRSGIRVEAATFGVASLLQKVAIGIAAAITGISYAAIGYIPGVAQPPAVISGIRSIMIAAPAIGCLLSALAMLANPLRRHTHGRIVTELAARRSAEITPSG